MTLSVALLSLLTALGIPDADWQSEFRQCAQESDRQIRLACYDALDRHINHPSQAATSIPQTSSPQAQHPQTGMLQTSPAVSTSADNAFHLQRDPLSGDLTLTRAVQPAGQLTVACVKNITYLRLLLPQPWQGSSVTTRMDGISTNADWFIRNNGSLLEYGRGLPAISVLKTWLDQQQITVSNSHGQSLTVPLSGLADAITPLRQQCHW